MSAARPLPVTDSSDSHQVLRPEIARIIDSGQQMEFASGTVFPTLTVSAASMLLLWMSFTPLDFGPLAWLALVPLCLVLRLKALPRYAYRGLFLVGFVWSLVTLQWMRLGHWTMYGALVALSFYMAFYLPVFVALGRRLVQRGAPLWLAAPLVWTTLEFARAWLLTGFSWYYLGHTQYQWTSLVQIADVTGVYGISFLMMLCTGAVASAVPAAAVVRLRLAADTSEVLSSARRQSLTGLITGLAVIVLSCGYGMWRMNVPPADQEGPVVAVVQGNFTPEIKHDPEKWLRMVREHDILTRRAAGLRPDLIVWPESMFPVPNQLIGEGVTDEQLESYLNLHSSVSNSELADQEKERWHSGYARNLLVNRAQEAGAAMMVGMTTELALADTRKRFNSASFIRPDQGYVDRYDKQHLLMFGEYIPLKGLFPWMADLSPYGGGFGLDAGESAQVFEYGGVRYSPVICFEDTVPHLVRDAAQATDADGRRPDVLLNLTNDAWFRGSSELDQHLITSTFRCIENRRPMVRSVNAGVSAFIDSCGRIRQPEHFLVMKQQKMGVTADFQPVDSMIDPATGHRYRQCSAVLCGQVPLDGRSTIYGRFGDWFAILSLLVTMGWLFVRRRELTPPAGDGSGVPPLKVTG